MQPTLSLDVGAGRRSVRCSRNMYFKHSSLRGSSQNRYFFHEFSAAYENERGRAPGGRSKLPRIHLQGTIPLLDLLLESHSCCNPGWSERRDFNHQDAAPCRCDASCWRSLGRAPRHKPLLRFWICCVSKSIEKMSIPATAKCLPAAAE